MKKIILVATIFIAIIFSACKKSKVEEPAPIPTHLGLWKGKYGITISGPVTEDVIIRIFPNGNARVFNGADTSTVVNKADGYWELHNGYQILLSYKYPNTTQWYSMFFTTDINFTTTLTGAGYGYSLWGKGNILNGSPFNEMGDIRFNKL